MKKVLASVLLFILVISSATNSFASSALKDSKEEIVYVLLGENGAESVYVVNSYSGNGEAFSDYGEYEPDSIRNLVSNHEILVKGDSLSGDTPENAFQYEGKLKKSDIPWNINIKYFLNGEETSMDKLSGEVGLVEIVINISKNENVNPVFYDNFVLQISTSFNSKTCRDITAEGGTIANAGLNKMVTFTMLPKSKDGKEIKISCVSDSFEMGAISFNAIPFSMKIDTDNIDLGSTSELTDAIAQLDEGVKKLDEGAKKLQSGMTLYNENSSVVANASSEVKDAIDKLNSSMALLNELTAKDGSIAKLKSAASQYAVGISEFSEKVSQLPLASGKIKSGLKTASDGLNTIAQDDEQTKALISGLGALNDPSINMLIKLYNTKMGAVSAVAAGLNELNVGYSAFDNSINELSKGANELSVGYQQINQGIQKLDFSSLSKLSAGVKTLASQYSIFNKGVSDYTSGFAEIMNGYAEISGAIEKLSEGTDELNNKTKEMEQTIKDKIDTAISDLSGEDYQPVSFTSDKNSNVAAVQFMMRTDAIELPEKEVVSEAEPEKLSFFEKFINLFK